MTEKWTRMTLDQIEASNPQMDRAKLDAMTEEDIRRYMIEDGECPDEPFDISEYRVLEPGGAVARPVSAVFPHDGRIEADFQIPEPPAVEKDAFRRQSKG